MVKRIGFIVGLMFFCLPAMAADELLDDVVAVVNDNVITVSEFNDELNVVKHQLAQRQAAMPSEALLKKQVIEHMVAIELQLQMAHNQDISVAKDEVDSTIERIAKRNRLSKAQLRQSVMQQGLDWQKYQANIKKEMTLARVQQTIVGPTVHISDEQLATFMQANQQHENTSFHVKNIVLSLPDAPTSKQLQSYKGKALELLTELQSGRDFSQAALEKSSGSYALAGGDLGFRTLAELPTLFAKQVGQMKVGEIAGPIRAANGFHIIKLVAIKGGAAAHKSTLTKVRHILIKTDGKYSDSSAKRKLQRIAKQISQKKVTFAAMAKKYSVDPGSREQGGELGWMAKGALVPPFEKAMNALKLGVISQPVKTRFGWHLIVVEGRKSVDDTLTHRKQQLRQKLFQTKFQEAVSRWQQQLRSSSYVKITL